MQTGSGSELAKLQPEYPWMLCSTSFFLTGHVFLIITVVGLSASNIGPHSWYILLVFFNATMDSLPRVVAL